MTMYELESQKKDGSQLVCVYTVMGLILSLVWDLGFNYEIKYIPNFE